MKISGGNNNGPIRPNALRDAQGDPAATRADRTTPSQIDKLDRVEISDAGRAKAEGLTSAATGNSKARLAEIRQRVLQGAYDTDDVVGQVAQRILDRGDL